LPGELTTALTLTKACGPYEADGMYIKNGGVLTIEAGVTIRFTSDTILSVGEEGTGKLLVNGTTGDPVTFTSAFDTPGPGDWYGVVFNAGTVAGSKIAYTKIQYAGGNLDAAIVGNSGMGQGVVTLDHVTILDNNDADGIMADDPASFVVTACTVEGVPIDL